MLPIIALSLSLIFDRFTINHMIANAYINIIIITDHFSWRIHQLTLYLISDIAIFSRLDSMPFGLYDAPSPPQSLDFLWQSLVVNMVIISTPGTFTSLKMPMLWRVSSKDSQPGDKSDDGDD